MDMLDKAIEFIKSCKPESTAIVYHTGCGDGIASAAILTRTFVKHFGKAPRDVIPASPGKLQHVKFPSSAKQIIFVDIAADQNPDVLLKLKNRAKIAIFDHHQINKNMNKFGILHVHPELFQKRLTGEKYCGSKLTYDICSKITNVTDLAWIAGIGLIHDMGAQHWKEFMDFIYTLHPELKKGKDIYGFDSELGTLTSILTSGRDIKDGERLALQAVLLAEDPEDIRKEEKLVAVKQARDKDVSKYVTNWKKYAKIYKDLDLAVLEVKSKFEIKSPVGTVLSIKNPDYTFVIIDREGNEAKLSFRSQKRKVDCNKLAKLSAVPLGGSGGGHVPAAGAFIPVKNLEAFKKKLPELVKQLSKK